MAQGRKNKKAPARDKNRKLPKQIGSYKSTRIYKEMKRTQHGERVCNSEVDRLREWGLDAHRDIETAKWMGRETVREKREG